MGLILVWRHRLIYIVLSLCKHACKQVCIAKQGVDPYLLLARSCDRWWPDFVTFTACKRSIFGLKRGKKVQCISNRCKDLVKRKKYFGIISTLRFLLNILGPFVPRNNLPQNCFAHWFSHNWKTIMNIWRWCCGRSNFTRVKSRKKNPHVHSLNGVNPFGV